MSKRKKLSHDQKRKAKLAQKAKRSQHHISLAYKGNKYKTDELVPVHFQTELAIYEAWLRTDREVTDRDVEATVENLVQEMRRGPLPPLAEQGEAAPGESDEDLIIGTIRRNWNELFEKEPRPSTEKLIGVLRTILGSIETWSSPSPTSRGYLHYIEGFLKKAGVSVDVLSPDDEPFEEPEEDDLLAVGQAWCLGGDPTAAADFKSLAETMIRTGEAERVVDVCQGLMGEAEDPAIISDLSKLSLWAQQKMRTRIE
jgi:hypothetical protein